MDKPRIILGSSGKQAKLVRAITRGLEEVADVEPWASQRLIVAIIRIHA